MELKIAFLNTAIGSVAEGRWAGQVDLLNSLRPDIVGLSEADHLADPDQVKKVEKALGMRVEVGRSNTRHRIAVAWRPGVLELTGCEDQYYYGMHHGYVMPRLAVPGISVPLAVAACHLNPYSAAAAAQEAQVLAGRAWRWDGLGVIIGDINHCPVWVDRQREEPDWSLVPPHNRSSRCLPRADPSEPLVGNQIVGQVLAQADLTDVAAHWARSRGDMDALRPTGKAGRLRVDQAHITPALVPAVTGYQVLETPDSDHDGIAFTVDTERIDSSRFREYA